VCRPRELNPRTRRILPATGLADQVALLANLIGLGQPGRDLVVDLVQLRQPEMVDVVARRERLDAAEAGVLQPAGQHHVAVDQRRRGVTAAKLMRTWNATRVFSGSTVTGPFGSASSTSRQKMATTSGSRPARWASRVPRPQVWVWLRLAKLRPQRGQVPSGPVVIRPPGGVRLQWVASPREGADWRTAP
jgi:hypothetical protein